MKGIYIALAIMFIIMTFGIIDVRLKFPDGTRFTYRGWTHLFID